jgi:fibrillarin-like rRNA methylase
LTNPYRLWDSFRGEQIRAKLLELARACDTKILELAISQMRTVSHFIDVATWRIASP